MMKMWIYHLSWTIISKCSTSISNYRPTPLQFIINISERPLHASALLVLTLLVNFLQPFEDLYLIFQKHSFPPHLFLLPLPLSAAV